MPPNRLLTGCSLFCLLLVAPVCTLASQPRYGGSLVEAISLDPKTFNTVVSTDANSGAAVGLLFESLTKEDMETLKVIPNLAQSWDVSTDGLQWTFHLRQDVQWFDGAPLTADDVVFTFNDLIYNPDIPSSSKDILTIDGKIFKVEKIDAYTVRFTLPVKFAPFLRAMAGEPILPRHCLWKAVRDKKFNFTWGIDTPPSQIIGTGPFMLSEYHPGERLVYKRNPHYWKKSSQGASLPYLDTIIGLIIQDPQAQLLKFIDGEIDDIAVSGVDYPLLKPMEKKKNFIIYEAGPNDGARFVAFNENPRVNPKTHKPYVDPAKLSWFTNLEFRRAVAHAIDRTKIIEIAGNGFGDPQNGPMSPSDGFFYNPNVPLYNYDLKTARMILEKAGFKYANGTLLDPQGRPVAFNFTTPASNDPILGQVSAIIRADLGKLGMKVNPVQVEFNVMVTKLMSTFDWDMLMIGLTGGIEPHFGQNVWKSSGGLHLWNPRQEIPATAWEKRLDEIFDEGVQELDENKRKVLYDEFQYIAADEVPLIYTVLGIDMYAVRQKFGNLHPTVHGGAFYNIEEIYVDQSHA